MLRKKAKVVAKEADKLILDFERETSCKECKNIFCGAKREGKIILRTKDDFKIGEEVELVLRGSSLVLLSVIIFLIPTLLFIGVIILFNKEGTFLSFSLGLGSLFFYFLLLKFILRSKLKDRFSCQLVRKEAE